MIDRSKIVEDLRSMGVESGDCLYVRAAVGSIGRMKPSAYEVFIGGVLEALGDRGTLLVPAFNRLGSVFKKPWPIIRADTPPDSGAVSKLALRHPDVNRSGHPSHSFAAIGPNADCLLEGHNEKASSFLPIKKLAALAGKMMIIGCNAESPGFSTVHAVQFDLGLSQQHYTRFLMRANIETPDGIKCWKPIESPGCSLSFDKFYPFYIRDENFRCGYVGKAWSLLVEAERAYAVELDALKANPAFVDCGRPCCLTCGFRGYQKLRIPFTFLSLAVREGSRLLRFSRNRKDA